MNKGRREPADLRHRAEERLERGRPRPHGAEADPHRLVHELQVHQIELELQNEELRTSRVELEAALSRYTQLFEFAPMGYFVVDSYGDIRELNFAGARLLGLERPRLNGSRLAAFVAEEDRSTFNQFLARALTAMTAEDGLDPADSCEVKLAREPGEPREVCITASDLALARDETEVLLAVADVTAQRRAEKALRDENLHKDEFLATLSHELRNPLGPIRNGLYLLERMPAGSEQAHRALAVVERQLGHLTRIVEDLLDVTRIARGKIQLAREPLDLGELVRRTVDDHRAGFDARGLKLEGRFEEGLCWVDGDATRLAQVLGNLLVNAETFTSRGGRVHIELRREGTMAALVVRDTGVGIDPDLRDRLFEPFTQGRQALDRRRGGLGLGLAMVKGLVELHGGSVSLASGGPGRGAEFTIGLPLIPAPRRARAPGEPHPTTRHRVLVIEDNEDGASSLRQVLELSGHEVHVASDGPSGLALAHQIRPEVVICDIGLPGMNGYEVARAIRADPVARSAFLIALTGYARPDDARCAAEAGFDRHLGKPPPIERLETMLSELPRPAGASAS